MNISVFLVTLVISSTSAQYTPKHHQFIDQYVSDPNYQTQFESKLSLNEQNYGDNLDDSYDSNDLFGAINSVDTFNEFQDTPITDYNTMNTFNLKNFDKTTNEPNEFSEINSGDELTGCPPGQHKSQISGECYTPAFSAEEKKEKWRQNRDEGRIMSNQPVSHEKNENEVTSQVELPKKKHHWFQIWRQHNNNDDEQQSEKKNLGFLRRFLNLFKPKTGNNNDDSKNKPKNELQIAAQQNLQHHDQNSLETSLEEEMNHHQQSGSIPSIERSTQISQESPRSSDEFIKQSRILPFTPEELKKMPPQEIPQAVQPLRIESLNEQSRVRIPSTEQDMIKIAENQQNQTINQSSTEQNHRKERNEPNQTSQPIDSKLIKNSRDINPDGPKIGEDSEQEDVLTPIAPTAKQLNDGKNQFNSDIPMTNSHQISSSMQSEAHSFSFPSASTEPKLNAALSSLPLPLKTESLNDIRILKSPINYHAGDLEGVDLTLQYQQSPLSEHTILCQLVNGVHGHNFNAKVLSATAINVQDDFGLIKLHMNVPQSGLNQTRHEIRCYMCESSLYEQKPHLAQSRADSVQFIHFEVNAKPTAVKSFVKDTIENSTIKTNSEISFIVVLISILAVFLI